MCPRLHGDLSRVFVQLETLHAQQTLTSLRGARHLLNVSNLNPEYLQLKLAGNM